LEVLVKLLKSAACSATCLTLVLVGGAPAANAADRSVPPGPTLMETTASNQYFCSTATGESVRLAGFEGVQQLGKSNRYRTADGGTVSLMLATTRFDGVLVLYEAKGQYRGLDQVRCSNRSFGFLFAV
jgi:hypothetical protein